MVYTACPKPEFSARFVPVATEVITGAVSSTTSVIENVTVVAALVLPAASLAVTVKL